MGAVLIDDASPGAERLLRFAAHDQVITATRTKDLDRAFADIGDALRRGRHVAGYFSYELGYALEPKLAPLLRQKDALPLLWFGVFDQPQIFEGCAAEALLDRMAEGRRAYAGRLAPDWDFDAYAKRFATVKDLIAAGDIYQANLTFRARFSFAGEPMALYRRLRAQSKAGHGAFVDDGVRKVMSFSPELFFEITPSGRIVTRPMKGTAARGADSAADALARASLESSAKDRAENLMIVDLLRNDLGRIADIGTVSVEELFKIETYPTLHQMVSTVSAVPKAGIDQGAILRALFPCGSVTGAPKIRAMEVIHALEARPRGVYCGSIGYFAPDGTARFNVAIRTVTIEDGRGELGIGGGLVQDSDAAQEYAECLLKAAYFETAREPIALIETMLFEPETGPKRENLHFERMARSAAALGLDFDVARAAEASRLATANAQGRVRVRMLLEETGDISVRAESLPLQNRPWTFAISPLRVRSDDALARYKTSWRSHYDNELARLVKECGCDEVVFLNERDEIVEGSRTNVFVRRGEQLITPPLASGALEGCLRRALIEEGGCEEAVLTLRDLKDARVYLGNSLRGLIEAVPMAQA